MSTPWRPERLAGVLDTALVERLTFLLVEELVDGIATVLAWPWPRVDAAGRLFWPGDQRDAVQLVVTVGDLHAQLYRDRLERSPRCGDVFAGEATGAWPAPTAAERPLDDLRPLFARGLYDLSAEGHQAARLAYQGSLSAVPDADPQQADPGGLLRGQVRHVPLAPPVPRPVRTPQQLAGTRSSSSVVARMPSEALLAPGAGRGTLLDAVAEAPDALVYFLLNVGDGDTQLLLLPSSAGDGPRRLVVVDVATHDKLPALLQSLSETGLIDPLGTAGQVALLVATHPHSDHVGGIDDLLHRLGPGTRAVEQFWDPGYWSPNPSFIGLMRRLEDDPTIRRLQPTSGTSTHLDTARVTVLGPAAGLRMRFDTYGVQVNDASLTLMVEFPGARLHQSPAQDRPGEANRRVNTRRNRRLLLGADAQFASWAQTTHDFPDLHDHGRTALQQELRASIGTDPLRADVFKLSHHASKNGVNVELLSRVRASLTLVSSSAGGGRYNFPHQLAMEAAREATQATARSGATRSDDHLLGIHVTGTVLESGEPVGSVALVVPPGRRPVRLFRLMDGPADAVDLTRSREALGHRTSMSQSRAGDL